MEVFPRDVSLVHIYINDVNCSVPNMALRLYADDTTGYNADASSLALQFMVNKNLSTLSTCMIRTNLLSINNTTNKSQAVILGSSTLYKYDLYINGMEIEVKPTLKILGVTPGVTLDRKISCKDRSP